MPSQFPACEVLIVGGGPAAATAARLLTLWGRRVILAARPPGDEPDLPESLTPSCGKFFDLLGIRPRIEAAGFVPSRGHTVWWGAPAPRVEPFADGQHGWQATVGRLGEVMVTAAADAGCVVIRQALTADQVLAWPAAYRVDCTGRAGVLAKPLGGRRYEPGHRTVALVGRWRHPGGWPLDDPSHTLLESYADGWAWSVPFDGRDRAIAVMVDPRTTALARGDGAATVYLNEVGKTTQLGRMAAGATLEGGPWGWDASMYSSERPAGDTWLLAGDAASFIDPLSSAGVRKAMASGWLAAVTVNTALADSRHQAMAFTFHAAREAETYAQFLALTRQHLRDGAPSDHPFWADRAAPPPVAAADRANVQAAYDRIRAAPGLALRVAPGVRFEARPALTERTIVLERHLVPPGGGDALRHLHGVDLVALAELAPGGTDVPALYDAYRRQMGPVDLPSFLTALATAVARGWLNGV
jgi:flavin-dependent dehydrogenase